MQNKEIIVYFANWHLGRKANRRGEVSCIPWDKITYVNHAFWSVAPANGSNESSFERRAKGAPARTDFTIKSMCPDNDLKTHFPQYEHFSAQYPNVRIMLSIGGWSRCGYFSEMAYTPQGRSSFVQSCVELIQKYPWIGGIDIDWEYPGCSTAGERLPDPNADDGDEGCPIWGTVEEDSTNFALLLAELRSSLDTNFGKNTKKITACAGGSTTAILPCQDWAALAPHLDMINLMTYDLAGVWDGVTGHASSFKGTKAAADYMISLGIPEEKLCIGSPLYAMAFVTKEPVFTQAMGIPCESYRACSQPITSTDCIHFQSEAQPDSEKPGWHQGYDKAEGAAYLYNNDASSPYYKWFLSYEDTTSLQQKLDYINRSDLAGVIIWECSQDTDDYVLISQMAQNLLKLS